MASLRALTLAVVLVACARRAPSLSHDETVALVACANAIHDVASRPPVIDKTIEQPTAYLVEHCHAGSAGAARDVLERVGKRLAAEAPRARDPSVRAFLGQLRVELRLAPPAKATAFALPGAEEDEDTSQFPRRLLTVDGTQVLDSTYATAVVTARGVAFSDFATGTAVDPAKLVPPRLAGTMDDDHVENGIGLLADGKLSAARVLDVVRAIGDWGGGAYALVGTRSGGSRAIRVGVRAPAADPRFPAWAMAGTVHIHVRDDGVRLENVGLTRPRLLPRRDGAIDVEALRKELADVPLHDLLLLDAVPSVSWSDLTLVLAAIPAKARFVTVAAAGAPGYAPDGCVRVHGGDVITPSGLTPTPGASDVDPSIRAAIRAQGPAFARCWADQLRTLTDPDAGGVLRVSFGIEADGHVRSVESEPFSSDASYLDPCVADQLRAIVFPRGAATIRRYPLDFSR